MSRAGSRVLGRRATNGPSPRTVDDDESDPGIVDRALSGASDPTESGAHHRSPGDGSNRSPRNGARCYPSVTPGAKQEGPRPRSSGIFASAEIPPVLVPSHRVVGVVPELRPRSGVATSTSGRKLRSRQARSRLTWSGVKAFGKGPGPRRELLRERTRAASLACQGRVGRRIAKVILGPAARATTWRADRPARPSGRTGREPPAGSFHRNPNPTSVTG